MNIIYKLNRQHKNTYFIVFRYYKDEYKNSPESSSQYTINCINKYKNNIQYLCVSPDFDCMQSKYHYNVLLKTNYIKGYLDSFNRRNKDKDKNVFAKIDKCDHLVSYFYYSHKRYAQYLLKLYNFPDEYIYMVKNMKVSYECDCIIKKENELQFLHKSMDF